MDVVKICEVVDGCEDCPKYGDDCDGDKMTEHTDYISRSDVIEAVHEYYQKRFTEDSKWDADAKMLVLEDKTIAKDNMEICNIIKALSSADVVQGWNNHEVACMLAELFGDACACNYNGIDEWLPFVCDLKDSCPNTVGVACWEQFLKHYRERREP